MDPKVRKEEAKGGTISLREPGGVGCEGVQEGANIWHGFAVDGAWEGKSLLNDEKTCNSGTF